MADVGFGPNMACVSGFFSVFRSRRVGWLTPIGFASGLPFLLSQGSLQTWMTVEGLSLKTIGFFALVSLPYNFKFMWAPFLDRYQVPWLGRRRGWMLLFQLLLVGFVLALGLTGTRGNLYIVAALALALAFCSASFDVVADAHRTDLLPEAERAAGTATFVTGYRVALLITGALAMVVADHVPWSMLYLVFAGLMAATIWATLRAPEPSHIRPPRTLSAAVVDPFVDFFSRRGALIALLFIVLYRFGDSIASTMTTPFLIRTVGFSQTEVGSVNKLFGAVATISGAMIGGAAVAKWGLRKPLFVFGGMAAVTNLLYASLAYTGKSFVMLFCAVGLDNFAGGMGSAAFVAFLMSLCAARYSATQYALLTSISSVGGRVFSAFSGVMAASLGWGMFYLITAMLIVPALLALALLPKSVAAAPEVHSVDPAAPGA